MSAPSPTFAGTLERSPLANLLLGLVDSHRTGTLVLETPDKVRHAAHFSEGTPDAAHSSLPVTPLGRVLLEMGLLEEIAHTGTLKRALAAQKRHGVQMLEEGVITPEQLAAGLREQLTRRLASFFQLPPATAFGFYEGADFLKDKVPTEDRFGADPLAVLWRGVRGHGDLPGMMAAVQRMGDPLLKIHRDAQVVRFGFESKERALVDVLRARPHKLSELEATRLASPEEVKRVVYTLALSRHLDLGTGKPPIGTHGSLRGTLRSETGAVPAKPPPRKIAGLGAHATAHGAPLEEEEPPPSSRSDALPPDSRREDVEAEAEALLAKKDFYELLGIDRTVSHTDVQRAFFEMAKRWHPDRLPPELKELRPTVERVFARITEAHQTLADDARRKQYDELSASTVDDAEQAEVERILRAATAFQRAEVHFKRRAFVEAEAEARIAAENDREQPDYAAFHAWVLANMPGGNPDLRELLEVLEMAHQRSPKNVRILSYQAQLQMRAGDVRPAIATFRKVLELDPKNLDAQREIRLFEMRRQASGASHPPAETQRAAKSSAPRSSIIGRLFQGGKDKPSPTSKR